MKFTCPQDSSHQRFQGISNKRCEFAVDLQADGSIVRETFRAEVGSLSTMLDHEVVCIECGAMARPMRAGLPFVPFAGSILKCDFTRGFVKPEMTKIRPVVVVSDRSRNRFSVLVVPCSTGAPVDNKTIAVHLPVTKYSFLAADNWAKCEMVYAVSHVRLANLDNKATGELVNSKDAMVDPADLAAIRDGVRQAIGLP